MDLLATYYPSRMLANGSCRSKDLQCLWSFLSGRSANLQIEYIVFCPFALLDPERHRTRC